ncbi:amphi-Trp domain-containing protein [Desulfogranum marinum]|uniref:amphi-Trp domain-containing protein n=1 Tax=Desulfogranum marinum TaxID=453220 RepID=UPI0019644CED|nr:amphi-Trp domain-containing protein [Desulfogranum marinum]MBM9514530.1 amphi-Trp domain-containing protein [Desulfogranum marinum]
MGKETVLFKTEEKMSRKAVANLMRQVADKLDNGKVRLQKGKQETVTLKIPDQVELEIKAEKEVGKRKTKKKLEIEIEWNVGDKQDKDVFTLG